MFDEKTGRIILSLFKVAVFLGVGTMIGFFLGLAFASHLYGTPPVVLQLQNWLVGDSLYEAPLPVDQSGGLMNSPVSIIPKIGACVGFGMATSVLVGSMLIRGLIAVSKDGSKKEPAKQEED